MRNRHDVVRKPIFIFVFILALASVSSAQTTGTQATKREPSKPARPFVVRKAQSLADLERRLHPDNKVEDLIGGAMTRIGSTVYDGSVRAQLQRLRQKMVGEQ